jgi:phosphate transport system substrate-binding protein
MKSKHIKKKYFSAVSMFCLLLLQAFSSSASDGRVTGPSAENYSTQPGIQGGLRSIGSDTLNNAMNLWAETFQAIYPNIFISIEGRGSGTALPALIENRAQLAPMSRLMKPKEIEAFKARFAYEPTPIKVALDAIGVFVHKKNPLERISMEELKSVFAGSILKTRTAISLWDQLGISAPDWAGKPIKLYSRNSFSGTYAFFQDQVLKGEPFSAGICEQANSTTIVEDISKDLYGIGYCGIGYKTSNVKALRIKGSDGNYYAPTVQNCLAESYPVSRYLYIYVNKAPGKPLDKIIQEFLRFALSKKGQEIIVKDGYFSLPIPLAKEELQKISS